MKLLVVDDEPTILETVQAKLHREGYTVFTAQSAEEGLRVFRKVKPDLCILDVMLPHRSGFDLCRAIRKSSPTPVIFLTARSGDADLVSGLDLGGDDYVVKPFTLSELAARIKAVLRRTSPEPSLSIECGDLLINTQTHEVTLGGAKLDLAPKEFALLAFLAGHRGQVFTRETLLDRVWGANAYVHERTVDVHIRWLRQRIEEDASAPKRLVTVRGVGYKFTD